MRDDSRIIFFFFLRPSQRVSGKQLEELKDAWEEAGGVLGCRAFQWPKCR